MRDVIGLFMDISLCVSAHQKVGLALSLGWRAGWTDPLACRPRQQCVKATGRRRWVVAWACALASTTTPIDPIFAAISRARS